ncbi:tetratricopeptide repeat protein [Rhodoplanes sp. TEM]|uniref:Tetratricopeptide repeat protein n=1 Tax=Rhodoplanes tepidamans TaxID=200616 RepID=A0ABT5J8H5_RHOTP|nr:MULTISPECIES: tetratricopeptide repeat protein [Rhodoplanes]MDC7785953.1 tetratricopeptide repeat protein [Rhodoplanes tepidamans]MDC7986235.1 tetratricopeptide repeat protein [Rhodoplanes sp. TEM]MDQ0355428.1 putative CXXCH cytochrome family protein [Rhodoplanes tepidamans]
MDRRCSGEAPSATRPTGDVGRRPASRYRAGVEPALAGLLGVALTLLLIATHVGPARRDGPRSWLAVRAEPTPAAAATGGPAHVGESVCRACHAGEAAAWTSSDHARAMAHASESTVLGDFNDARFTYGDVTSVFFRRDGKYFVRTDGPAGDLQDYEITFTFGVEPLQQYLIALPGGRLQALSIAWDSRAKEQGGRRWFHLHPGEKVDHRDPLHWTGLQQNWNYMCAECHSTGLRRNYDPGSKTYATTFSAIDVSCESCHGPGARHVAWAKREPGWEAIDAQAKGLMIRLDERRGVTWAIDPRTGSAARSKPRQTTREIETCALCHARRAPIWATIEPGAPIGDSHRVALLDEGLYFPDGQSRDEVYEYGSFLQSKMFAAGVTCSDCHDPHSLTLRASGNAVCVQCHAPERFESASHHRHRQGSTAAQCVACHMPARTYMVVDPRRDHGFRIPRPDQSAALGTPDACTACHADKTSQWAAKQIRAWHGAPRPGFIRFGDVLHAGSRGAPGARASLLALAQDRSHPAIARASALARLDRIADPAALAAVRMLLRDSDPLVRRAAAAAYTGAPTRARRDVLSLLDDPVRDVRLEAARQVAGLPAALMSADEQKQRDRGIEEYVASLRSNADRPEAHHNLGLLLMDVGRPAEAESELTAALTLDPSFVPAAVTLADLLRALGRDAEAEPLLRGMIERQPNAASPHHALGLWLVRANRRAEAIDALKRAADLAPDDPRMAYVYAVALSATDRAKALATLRESLARHPHDRETLSGLAAFSRDAGARDDALHYAETLAALEPDDPSVRAFVRQMRGGPR